MVAGAWFMTGECELSTARAGLIKVLGRDTSSPTVKWHLPASKADPQAMGVTRTHGCSCKVTPSPLCPVHCLWDQLLHLRHTFPLRWNADGPHWDLPLFPTVAGEVVEKEAMAHTIREAARLLGLPLSSPDNAEQITGHSLRATGAQGLARAGLDLWAIQLLGRWGSEAVKTYVRQAALDRATTWAARATKQLAEDASSIEKGSTPELLRELAEGMARAAAEKQSGVLSALCKVLVASAVDEEIKRLELSPQSSSSSSEPPQRFVKNLATGIVHVLAPSDSKPLASWASKCGWKLAKGSNASSIQVSDPPCLYKAVCEKCMPQLRHKLKLDLGVSDGTQ